MPRLFVAARPDLVQNESVDRLGAIAMLTSFLVGPDVAVAVGLCFGFYPARRASRLDPIEALRHE